MEKYSLWLWKKPGKLGEFFPPTLWSPYGMTAHS